MDVIVKFSCMTKLPSIYIISVHTDLYMFMFNIECLVVFKFLRVRRERSDVLSPILNSCCFLYVYKHMNILYKFKRPEKASLVLWVWSLFLRMNWLLMNIIYWQCVCIHVRINELSWSRCVWLIKRMKCDYSLWISVQFCTFSCYIVNIENWDWLVQDKKN